MASTQQTTSAGTKLINITELLENILLHLSERDLLRAQQVSRIKTVTDSSLLLQQKLFLAPEPPSSSTNSTPRPNPLLFSGADPFFDRLTPMVRRGGEGRRPEIELRLGDDFRDLFEVGRVQIVLKGTECSTTAARPQATLLLKQPRVTMDFIRRRRAEKWDMIEEGGWQDMLLFQPPTEIRWKVDIGYGIYHYQGKLAADTTLADLVALGPWD